MQKSKYSQFKGFFKNNIKIGDLVCFLLILTVSIFAIIYGITFFESGDIVEIVSQQNIYRYPINQNRTIKIRGAIGDVTIEINNKRIRLLEENSPYKIGVKMGWVDIAGLSIICLPCKVSATIIPQDKDKLKFDAISE